MLFIWHYVIPFWMTASATPFAVAKIWQCATCFLHRPFIVILDRTIRALGTLLIFLAGLYLDERMNTDTLLRIWWSDLSSINPQYFRRSNFTNREINSLHYDKNRYASPPVNTYRSTACHQTHPEIIHCWHKNTVA